MFNIRTDFKKIIACFLLIAIIVIYTFILFSNIQNQISVIELAHQELESKIDSINYDSEFSDIDNEISNIYSNISNLYEVNKSYDAIENEFIINDANNHIYEDLYDSYYGRLFIPDLDISVAMYYGKQTYITDRTDSANIFDIRNYYGLIIADHNNQSFYNLSNVEVGTKGYILTKYMDVISIECVDKFNGHNIGKFLVDEDDNMAMGRADYMMYTCRDNWQNIMICLWSAVDNA